MNKIDSLSGTRGTRIDVVGSFEEVNADRVEIVASHTDDQQQEVSRDAVGGWLRGQFAVGRGIELWSDTDNEVELTVVDKAGNSDTDTHDNITLDTDASASYSWNAAGCLTADGTYTYDVRGKTLSC